MKKSILFFFSFLFFINIGKSQISWKEVSAEYGVNTPGFKVFESVGTLADSAFRAFYVKIDKAEKKLFMDTDTTLYRRLTPNQFYEKLNNPLLVVNCSFFEFKNNTNVNMVVQKGKLVGHNLSGIPGKGKDTLTYLHVLNSAMGKTVYDRFEIAYTFTDSALKLPYVQATPLIPYRDSSLKMNLKDERFSNLKPWNVQWAVGGGPVLMTNGKINITNNQEHKFAGKAILDRHPRTAMGYTIDGDLIVMVIQGRMKGIAVGATLTETALLFKQLGCEGAINLDGGGSSCMLINGKETIKPSDPTGQRPVPAVFYVAIKN
jgi:exopolysaccharide biosynthesis protein